MLWELPSLELRLAPIIGQIDWCSSPDDATSQTTHLLLAWPLVVEVIEALASKASRTIRKLLTNLHVTAASEWRLAVHTATMGSYSVLHHCLVLADWHIILVLTHGSHGLAHAL